MPTTRMTIPAAWGASGRIDASGSDLAVHINNTDASRRVYWATKSDTVVPALSEQHGNPVEPRHNDHSQEALTLKDGESLFLATAGEEFPITVTTGVA